LNLVLGPNGSGKSTLFGLAAGWLKPKHGSVGPVAAAGASDIRVALVPQRSSAIRGFTVREQAQYVAWLGGVPSKQLHANAESALALVGLEAHASERASDLSGGQLHRLSMAGGLATQPDLIILDEPTAGVDPVGSAAIGQMIMAMKSKGKTIVLCSHLLGQVEQVCDRIAIMDRGKLVLEGRVDDVLTRRDQNIITVENLSPDARRAAEEVLAQHGAKITSITHPRRSLDDLFRELVTGSRDA
jgi:ABC-2 type transport system ATP-binding protein